MMKKPKSSLKGIVKIVLLIPAVLLTLGLATGMSPQEKGIKGRVIFAGSGAEPAPGASVVIAGTTMGTVTDIDGMFRLNVEGDPEIVISFVGYQTLKLRASEIGRKPLELEPKVYTLDLGDIPEKKLEKITGSTDIPEEKDSDKEIFFIVEDMPSFPGGNAALKDYIYSNLEYPESARKEGITGEVLVQFLVTASGKLKDIRVVRSSYAAFERPAMAVFEDMPDWSPGRQRNKPVAVNVIVPVRFNPGKE